MVNTKAFFPGVLHPTKIHCHFVLPRPRIACELFCDHLFLSGAGQIDQSRAEQTAEHNECGGIGYFCYRTGKKYTVFLPHPHVLEYLTS